MKEVGWFWDIEGNLKVNSSKGLGTRENVVRVPFEHGGEVRDTGRTDFPSPKMCRWRDDTTFERLLLLFRRE